MQVDYNPKWCPTSQKVSKRDFEAIPLRRHNWQGDWKYTITPAA